MAAQNDAHDHAMGATMKDGTSGSAQPLDQAQAAASQSVLGFDVSGYQPNVDWNTAVKNGAKFVYIKATESFNSTNSSFASQWSGATLAGLARGAYHFADPYESQHGATEANWFLSNGATWSPDGKTLPPVLDLEKNPYRKYGAVSVDECYNMTPGQLATWIRAFSSTIYTRLGIRPTIYTNPDFWQTCMTDSSSFGANPLFIANWTYNVATGPGTLPASWSSYVFWQYADDAGAPRFPGDQDVFNGTLGQLTTFAANTTPNSKYISALYRDYLGRSAGATELASWENLLGRGAPWSSVASGFVNSDEYRLSRIDGAYRSILGRDPDPNGRIFWLNQMHSGNITTDDIETSLYASQEYFVQHGNTNTGFADALYTTLLHRSGSAAEYAFWSNLAVQHGRPWVLAQFWDSTETISERVSAMYALYLGRTPDPQGLQTWVAVALQLGDSGLRSGFTSSAEYYDRAQSR